jgi:hypothetical protein
VIPLKVRRESNVDQTQRTIRTIFFIVLFILLFMPGFLGGCPKQQPPKPKTTIELEYENIQRQKGIR